MGGVLAELLATKGVQVTLVTPAALVSEWTVNTLEQSFIQKQLIEMGVTLRLSERVMCVGSDYVETGCVYAGRMHQIPADAVVMVTSRLGHDDIWHDLRARQDQWADHGIRSIKLIGDAAAPAPIAWATYAGHNYATEIDGADFGDAPSFRREITALSID